jgi:hypothetical protein
LRNTARAANRDQGEMAVGKPKMRHPDPRETKTEPEGIHAGAQESSAETMRGDQCARREPNGN